MMDLASLFTDIAAQYGLPPAFLQRTAQIESGGNPNAQNRGSSAGGLFQFIDKTAEAMGLRNKFDPVASTDAAARLASENKAKLARALGRDPSPAELYLAHQQGATGAVRLLTNPNVSAASVVGPKAVRLNGGRGNMTAGEFAQMWTDKFDGTKVADMRAQVGGATPAPLLQGQGQGPDVEALANLPVQQEAPSPFASLMSGARPVQAPVTSNVQQDPVAQQALADMERITPKLPPTRQAAVGNVGSFDPTLDALLSGGYYG